MPRKQGKKTTLHNDCARLHRNTLTSFRKVEKNAAQIDAYHKSKTELAEEMSTAGFINWVGAGGVMATRHNNDIVEWFTPAGILDAAAAKYSQSKVLKETAKVAQNKGKAPTLAPNGAKVRGKATPTFGPVGPKVNNRATAVAAEKGLRADTEAVNAIQLGRLHIQARLGELMPPGKRGPGKKVSSGTLTKLSKPTLACFRKVEKNAAQIDAYHKSNGKRRGTCWATLIGASNGTSVTGSTPGRLPATCSGASTKRRASGLGSRIRRQ